MAGTRLNKQTKSIIRKSVKGRKREGGVGLTKAQGVALRKQLRSPGVSKAEKALVRTLMQSVRKTTTRGEAQGVKAAIKRQRARSVRRAKQSARRYKY